MENEEWIPSEEWIREFNEEIWHREFERWMDEGHDMEETS
jgi:hypothetical protein